MCISVCLCVGKGNRSREGTGRRWPRLPIHQQLLGFSCWTGWLGRRRQLARRRGGNSGSLKPGPGCVIEDGGPKVWRSQVG